MVTSLNLIESKGKVEGDSGVMSEKIGRVDKRAGSWKAGSSGGLEASGKVEETRPIAGVRWDGGEVESDVFRWREG